jgi:hypothetical protein
LEDEEGGVNSYEMTWMTCKKEKNIEEIGRESTLSGTYIGRGYGTVVKQATR